MVKFQQANTVCRSSSALTLVYSFLSFAVLPSPSLAQPPSSGNPVSPPVPALVGRWLAPMPEICPFVFQYDDGHTAEATCVKGGYQHLFHARYISPDRLEFVGERIDPRGCRVTALGTIHLLDVNTLETTLSGWNGCGVRTSPEQGSLRRQFPLDTSAVAPPDVPSAPVTRTPVYAAGLPDLLHECDVNCNTLKLEGDHYVLQTRYPWDTFNGPIIWTVESFIPESVKLHRTYPVDQKFEGKMSADLNSTAITSINGVPNQGVRLAWGAALNTVYGSNAQRDRVQASISNTPIEPVGQAQPSAGVSVPRPVYIVEISKVQLIPPLRKAFEAVERGDCTTYREFMTPLLGKGNLDAQAISAEALARGTCVPSDPPEALRRLTALQEQGNVRAMFVEGLIFRDGVGVPQNGAEAVKWLRRAADLDFDMANAVLGQMFVTGQIVPKDYTAARKHFEAVLVRGNDVPEKTFAACAQILGVMYSLGMGGQKDTDRALALFALAAIHGDAQSQFNMAQFHGQGNHVPANGARSLMWLRLAADHGHVRAIQIRKDLLGKVPPDMLAQAERMFEIYSRQTMQQRLDVEIGAFNAGGEKGSVLDARSPSGITLGQVLGMVIRSFTAGQDLDEEIQEKMNRGMNFDQAREQVESSRYQEEFEQDMFSPAPK